MIAILLITLFSSFTNVNLTNSSAKPLANSLTNAIVVNTVAKQNVAENYLWEYFKVESNNLPINLPMDSTGFLKITDAFGWRKVHPVLKHAAFHAGIDFAGKRNSNILASADGIVTLVDYSSSYGKYIVIDHGNGLTTLYAHLSKQLVEVGDKVSITTVIGKLGSTGWSTGPHLHFEIRVHDRPIDMYKLLADTKVSEDSLLTTMISNRIKNENKRELSDGTYHLQKYSNGDPILCITGSFE
jgi:murein DD-endopeptidase MepM/ murein hydrolase activator NlpD